MAYKVRQTGANVQLDLDKIEDVVSTVEGAGKAADAIKYTHEKMRGVDSVDDALDKLADEQAEYLSDYDIAFIWNNN